MKVSLFQGILYGVFILAALIGLFVFSTYTSKNTGSNSIGPVVIWGTLPREDMTATLNTLGQTQVGLKSVTYKEKDAATLPTDLAAAIATGDAPDLVLASQEQLHTLAKFITPVPVATLPANIFESTFVEEGKMLAAPGGGYYGIPFLIDPLVLFVNRSILSSSGIARPPSTWEALTGLVSNIAQLTPTRQVTRGLIGLGTYDNVRNARGILSTIFLQTSIPLSTYSPSGVTTADLGGASASGGQPSGRSVLAFYTQFADPSKVSYTWNASLQDSQRMFLAGNLALYLGYASEARFMTAANPNLNFGVSPVPQPATAATKNVYGLLYSLMMPRGAKNASGALQAATILINAASQATAAVNTGLAPATLAQLSVRPPDPIAAVAYAEALYAHGWLSPMPASTDALFSGMITSVIIGRLSTQAALISTEQALTALLQQ